MTLVKFKGFCMLKRYVYLEGLTNLLGSGGKYLINNDGQIKDIKGNDIQVRLDGDGHKVVNCVGFDGLRDYRVIDLVAIQFKGLYIPVEDYNKVIAFCIDGNKENTHASNVGYRFEGGKLEYKPCPGFYYIPGFTRGAINIDGVLVSTKNNQVLKWVISKPKYVKNIRGGYYMASVVFTKGTQAMLSRHRAMLLVFKGYPDNVDKLLTNHIDGKPGNDYPDNLEWSTHAENNLHARMNNLRTQQKAVLTRNVKTGEVKEYLSLGDCSKALGLVGPEPIRIRLVESRFGTMFKDGYQLKYKSDSRDWINPEDVDKSPRVYEFIAKNIRTGEEHVFKDVKSVSEIIPDYSSRPICTRLNMGSFEIYKGFQFKLLSDERPFPPVTEKDLEKIHPVGGYGVDARNLLSGETKTYPTIRQAAKDFNSYISTTLRDGKQPIFEDGWQLKFSSEEWNTTDDFDKETYKSQKNIMALELATRRTILAESITAMAQVLKLDYSEVRDAAYSRGNKVCHGYRIRLGITSDPWPTTET